MPKVKKSVAGVRHDPLAQQYAEAPQCTAPKQRKKRVSAGGSDDEEDFVPAAMSRKIIQHAREQQQEMEDEKLTRGLSSSESKSGQEKNSGHFDDFLSGDEEEVESDGDDLVHRDGDYVEEVEVGRSLPPHPCLRPPLPPTQFVYESGIGCLVQ